MKARCLHPRRVWFTLEDVTDPKGGHSDPDSERLDERDPPQVDDDVSSADGHSVSVDDPVSVDDEELVSLKKLAGIGLGLFVLYFASTFFEVWWTSTQRYDGAAPAAIVLGAAQYNGEPSGALRGRLDRAAELYADGDVELIVVTGGGQDEDVTTEAKTGYDYLRESAGIPDEDLRLEVQGRSTYESMAATARFLEDEGIVDVIVVTDPYHARRSTLIANEVGLEAEAVPTDASVTAERLVTETVAVGVGRLVSFRRLDRFAEQL